MKWLLLTSLLFFSVLGIVLFQSAYAEIQIDPASLLYNDNGNSVPYKLITNATTATILTHDGSIVANKNSCSVSFYNGENTNTTPLIGSDTYSVLASQGNTGIWNPVSIINNAACTPTITQNNGVISVIGTKSVSGAGVFSINYTKQPYKPFKITFSATNNNPAWTNFHIGLLETIQVPKNVTLGSQSYDLSQFNNTVLDRTWITNHNAQLIHLNSNMHYDMGPGWNNADHVVIHWINNKASLDIYYTYNTPILSPGQTITVDPSLTIDTTNSNSGTTSTGGSVSITVGSHTNRLLAVTVSYDGGSITSVKIGSTTLTNATVIQKYFDGVKGTQILYLTNATIGSNTITLTGVGFSDWAIGAYSLYNVHQSSPIGATNGTYNPTPGVRQPDGLITPTNTGSIILDTIGTVSTAVPVKDSATTQMYNVNPAANRYHASQYNLTPTISAKNSMSWSGLAGVYQWWWTAAEIKSIHVPATPTLTKVNTINSTGINATWTNPAGTTWSWLNATLSGGATSHINTTNTFVFLNNLTAGSKYTFSLVAANSTGKSPSSLTKFNYTFNVAPTAPTASSITTTGATISITPPSGNYSTSGFKFFIAPVSTGIYSLAGTTSGSTSLPISGLTDDTNYDVKVSTRYAVGTNYTGSSSNSTIISWYTLPNTPSGLAISQSVVNVLHLTWAAPTGLTNPILGYKIERSIDFGLSWLTIVANTGTTGLSYDDSGLITGDTYTYRVSVITIAGTSSPTSEVSAVVLSSIQLNPTSSTFSSYNTTAIALSFSSSARSGTTYDVFPITWTSYNATTGKQTMSWYTGASGSPTLTKRLGLGLATLTLSCNLSNTYSTTPTSNGTTKIYYECDTGSVNHIDILTGVNTHDFTSQDPSGGNQRGLFLTQHHIFSLQRSNTGFHSVLSYEGGNTTQGTDVGILSVSNQKLFGSGLQGIKYNYNSTVLSTVSSSECELNLSTSNSTTGIDNIACDYSIPVMGIRYWNGMFIQKVSNYATDNMRLFTSSIDVNPYKKLLSLPCTILGADNTSCSTFILTDGSTNTDYIIVLTATHVYYMNATTAMNYLTGNSYAFQSYYITPYGTTSSFNLPSPLLQSIKLYGPSLNVTVSKTGLVTLPSGYTIKGTSIESAVRTVDPRWSNDNTDIPLLTTTPSLFQIFITVSNAPVNSAMMVTYPSATIDSIAGVWTVVNLDATRSAEFDIPNGLCGLVYVADISTLPTIWNFEGQVCATGTNQKTIAYTNTLPLNFWTLPYGVTHSFVPSTNGLTTAFHSTTPGVTYTVDIKNSTGAVAQTYTFTMVGNSTLDTESYNVTGVAKPAGLFVYVGSNLVYSAYLGSALTLASIASFFNTYMSYQGFSLLAFIPIVFAAMFTRNTVGIGVVLTVLCIATLSWLSVVVIPDIDIGIMMLIAIIGLIAYRIYYG